MKNRMTLADALTKADPDHGGVSFMDALRGAAQKQRELEKIYGKPPKGHVSSVEFDMAVDAAERLAGIKRK